MRPNQKITIGLDSYSQVLYQRSGLYLDEHLQTYEDYEGNKLINTSITKKNPYKHEFYLFTNTS